MGGAGQAALRRRQGSVAWGRDADGVFSRAVQAMQQVGAAAGACKCACMRVGVWTCGWWECGRMAGGSVEVWRVGVWTCGCGQVVTWAEQAMGG